MEPPKPILGYKAMDNHTFTIRLTNNGRITIPKPIRDALGLKPGNLAEVALVDGETRIRPVKSRLLEGYGAVPPKVDLARWQDIRREIQEEIAGDVLKEA